MTSHPLAERLARFAVEQPSRAIPPEVVECARLHVLDTVGCGLAAVALEEGAAATAVALEQGGRSDASLLGEPDRQPAALAAFANGTRCHALDFDDTHEAGICHVSTVVLPAALAVGEKRGVAGAELLDAYGVGCEVALRVAIAVADGLYARGFHPTPICGAFGATAAACRLLGSDPAQTANALGIAGSFAAGLFEYLADGSATKPLHAGWAAQAGVQAALLAAVGVTGPATVLEGRFGLLASHTDVPANTALSMCDGLGEHWELPRVSIKAFPACHFVHSSTWAVAELAREHRLDAQGVIEIVVRVPAEGVPIVLEPLARKRRPTTPYDAKFSLPFAVAHQLVHGHLGLSAFSPAAISDPQVLALSECVRFEPLAEGVPASRFAGGARLMVRGGSELDAYLPHAPGSPDNPLGEHRVVSKFQANAELTMEAAALEELASALLGLDTLAGIDKPMALLRAAATRAPAAA